MMGWESSLPLLLFLSSFAPGLVIFFLEEEAHTTRTVLNLFGALLKLALLAIMVPGLLEGRVYETRLPLLPEIDLVLRADSLSVLFIVLSASLWLVTTIYAIGYLEYSPNRSRFFGFFSLCVSSTMGIALAGNPLTFLIFYEMLTICTYPLVVHRGTPQAMHGGRVYLAYTLSGGVVLLIGVIGLHVLAGPVEFVDGGALDAVGARSPEALRWLFPFFMVGFGVKAALVPLHGWLPRAMVAPAPVSALLHAVAVVKAGAFGIVRVVYDLYGVNLAHELGLIDPLLIAAAITIIVGSLFALNQDDLKKRLAYSTVSQVSYIILGAATFGLFGAIGGLLHLVHQGVMKITLFFCAGNFAETLGIHKVSEMDGVGRRMPLTMAAFTVAALGMIGVPPTAGFISKWFLGAGSLQAENGWALGVLLTSSLLNAAYFLPILYRGWFKPQQGAWPEEHLYGRMETHWMLLFPPAITGAFVLLLGVLANMPFGLLRWVEFLILLEYRL
ncbi:MAG: proton-conducting transporter membrane subunit [Caldilinea sp.]|uniref:proton-conducting transporter transmembrane domain-containing protein n=2 Tax=Caldilinea sp. TaxID=2293560 RepID=UPI0021DC6DA0|nr:proton-conducting transporter membrane subunit [Caldilinea sp.]GIV68940.1 MAG: cation:proton antiporter [Caldilinea sp.]